MSHSSCVLRVSLFIHILKFLFKSNDPIKSSSADLVSKRKTDQKKRQERNNFSKERKIHCGSLFCNRHHNRRHYREYYWFKVKEKRNKFEKKKYNQIETENKFLKSQVFVRRCDCAIFGVNLVFFVIIIVSLYRHISRYIEIYNTHTHTLYTVIRQNGASNGPFCKLFTRWNWLECIEGTYQIDKIYTHRYFWCFFLVAASTLLVLLMFIILISLFKIDGTEMWGGGGGGWT